MPIEEHWTERWGIGTHIREAWKMLRTRKAPHSLERLKKMAEERIEVDEREDGDWRIYYVLNNHQRMPLTCGCSWRIEKNQLAGAFADFAARALGKDS
jgi:hypothetical protein